ncbi:hypothetical protein H8356DRAFT_1437851 [Neocallimastix lanati (nom. inval.)]|nr:hypothetical protein H8356DRAFT_1437851 [Neocallimastix sp. JGI-2020a]
MFFNIFKLTTIIVHLLMNREWTRTCAPKGNGLAGHRVNHSAKVTMLLFDDKKYIGELNRNNIVNPLINLWRFVFSDSNKLTLFITKVFGYRPGNNSSTFNVSTHEGAGTFQALANKELTSPKANWASGL